LSGAPPSAITVLPRPFCSRRSGTPDERLPSTEVEMAALDGSGPMGADDSARGHPLGRTGSFLSRGALRCDNPDAAADVATGYPAIPPSVRDQHRCFTAHRSADIASSCAYDDHAQKAGDRMPAGMPTKVPLVP
jgi:hypothetical protein